MSMIADLSQNILVDPERRAIFDIALRSDPELQMACLTYLPFVDWPRDAEFISFLTELFTEGDVRIRDQIIDATTHAMILETCKWSTALHLFDSLLRRLELSPRQIRKMLNCIRAYEQRATLKHSLRSIVTVADVSARGVRETEIQGIGSVLDDTQLLKVLQEISDKTSDPQIRTEGLLMVFYHACASERTGGLPQPQVARMRATCSVISTDPMEAPINRAVSILILLSKEVTSSQKRPELIQIVKEAKAEVQAAFLESLPSISWQHDDDLLTFMSALFASADDNIRSRIIEACSAAAEAGNVEALELVDMFDGLAKETVISTKHAQEMLNVFRSYNMRADSSQISQDNNIRKNVRSFSPEAVELKGVLLKDTAR